MYAPTSAPMNGRTPPGLAQEVGDVRQQGERIHVAELIPADIHSERRDHLVGLLVEDVPSEAQPGGDVFLHRFLVLQADPTPAGTVGEILRVRQRNGGRVGHPPPALRLDRNGPQRHQEEGGQKSPNRSHGVCSATGGRGTETARTLDRAPARCGPARRPSEPSSTPRSAATQMLGTRLASLSARRTSHMSIAMVPTSYCVAP
jgi:hypothetical protein